MRHPKVTRARLSTALVAAALVAAGCDSMTGPTLAEAATVTRSGTTPTNSTPGTPTTPTTAGSPFAATQLFLLASSSAQATANEWRNSRPADAAAIDRIARSPEAIWLGEWSGDVGSRASSIVASALGAGALPVFVAYNIPQRDCGQYSAGGAGGGAAYRTWIRSLADGIGSRPAVVLLEPDAVAGADCLSTADRATRFALLREAVQTLKAKPGISVYIDAGHPGWHAPEDMSSRLQQAGIAQADGFALNVSNFIATADNVAYGEKLSPLVGGKHFVIDTSRNGRGAAGSEWCNPAGRGLGIAPTVQTGNGLVDALLWIKAPGESDGTCNGGPPAGEWWAEYALGLARNATDATRL